MRIALLALALTTIPLAAPAQAQDDPAPPDARVEAALKTLDLSYDVEENGDYALDFDLDSGRGQTVWVRPTTAQYGTLAMREVFSIAFTPTDSAAVVVVPNLAMRLLEENTDLVAGAWCVEDGGIVFIVRVPAEASPDELMAAIHLAMTVADGLDDELHDGDDVW